MDDAQLQSIYNYRQVTETIASAGQPTTPQLAAVARAGYTVVINLGLHGERYALQDEPGTVKALGMEYVYIPVIWEQPTRADLERFFAAMDARGEQKVFVHCAANYRASAFLALYAISRWGWAADDALRVVRSMQFPQVWQDFISCMLAEGGVVGA